MTTTLPTLPARKDPANVDSELGADDLAVDPGKPSKREEDIVSLIEERFQSATNARRPHEHKPFLSLAFYLGQQHLGWSTNGARLVDARKLSQGWRTWTSHNKIKPKILKLQARALEDLPDASFRPKLLDSPRDQAAASEGRAVHETLCQRDDETAQIADEILWALTTSTVCRKYSWDPTMEAEVPDYDAQGNLTGTTRARVGDIRRETVPVFDLYVDPKARIRAGKIERCAWIIHSHIRDLQDVQTQYGKDGLALKGEVAAGQDGYIESRMASIVGDNMQASANAKKSAVVVRECWEKPSLAYPEGRLIVTAGGRLLRYLEAWPCRKRDEYPFVPLSFQNGVGTFYGDNAVYDLISPQRTYNRSLGALDESLESPYGKWLVPRGAELGADALNDPREAVYYVPSFEPKRLEPIPVADVVTKALQIAGSDIDDLSGLHDVSDGDAPKDVTAASALEILRQQDASQMRPFKENLSSFRRRCAQWEVSLASDYYSEPRLVAVQDVRPSIAPEGQNTGEEKAAGGPQPHGPDRQSPGVSQVMDFRNLTSGGSCHIVIEEGSAASITPIARLQLIKELFTENFFGPAGDPRASLAALEMMSEIRDDGLIQRLIALRKEMQAEAAAAQKAQADQQQANNDAKSQQQAQQSQAGQQMAVLQAALKQAQDQAAAQQKAIADGQQRLHEAEMKSVQLHADLSKAQIVHAHDLEKQAQQIQHERSNVRVNLSGTLDPPETAHFASEADSQEADNVPTEKTGGQGARQKANAAQAGSQGSDLQEADPAVEAASGEGSNLEEADAL